MSQPPRVAVVGNGGSSKSTLARALAARIDGACIELDAIYHHLLATDLAIKTGRLNQVLALDLLVADLTSSAA